MLAAGLRDPSKPSLRQGPVSAFRKGTHCGPSLGHWATGLLLPGRALGVPVHRFSAADQEVHEEGPGPREGSSITCRGRATAVAHGAAIATWQPAARTTRDQPSELQLKVHLPVTLLIAEIVPYFVHDRSSGKDVGFVFLLGVVFNQHY